MDVFKLDHNLARLGTSPTDAGKLTAEVSFDTTSDFGLNFFEDPTSSPPPPQQPKKEHFSGQPHCIFEPIFNPGSVIRDKSAYPEKVEFVKFESVMGYASDCHSSSNSPTNTVITLSSPVISSEDTDTSTCDLHPLIVNEASLLYDRSAPSPTETSSPASQKSLKSEASSNAADSNTGNCANGKSFIPCKVCGDKASGYHYGVTSCEGCKGFFRRSIQKQIEYRCLRDGKCLVIRLNRNRCQYCRFKKCLAVGMSRDSVRYGRVPKRNREQTEDATAVIVAAAPVEGLPREVASPSEEANSLRQQHHQQQQQPLSVYDFTAAVLQAYLANCAYTEDRISGLLAKPATFPPCVVVDSPEGASSTMESLENQKLIMWQQLAMYMTPCIQRIVEFAKRVPGFQELTQDDQLILIKVGFFEMWLARMSRTISSLDETLTFAEGVFFTGEQLNVVFNPEFVASLFQFASSFNSLALGDAELALFSAAILLTSDRPGLSNPKVIEGCQERIAEALKLQVSKRDPGVSRLFPTLLTKLAELRNLSGKHGDHLPWFRAQWQRLKLPPLFAEIFDIPKNEEDSH